MFCKLSALALCGSFVSALQLTVQPTVTRGQITGIHATDIDDANGPITVGIALSNDKLNFNKVILDSVVVKPGIQVTIPSNVSVETDYVSKAFDINTNVTIATSNSFMIILT